MGASQRGRVGELGGQERGECSDSWSSPCGILPLLRRHEGCIKLSSAATITQPVQTDHVLLVSVCLSVPWPCLHEKCPDVTPSLVGTNCKRTRTRGAVSSQKQQRETLRYAPTAVEEWVDGLMVREVGGSGLYCIEIDVNL